MQTDSERLADVAWNLLEWLDRPGCPVVMRDVARVALETPRLLQRHGLAAVINARRDSDARTDPWRWYREFVLQKLDPMEPLDFDSTLTDGLSYLHLSAEVRRRAEVFGSVLEVFLDGREAPKSGTGGT